MKRDSLYILTSLVFGMMFSSLGFAEPTTVNKSTTMKEPLNVILDFHNPKSIKMVDNILEHTSKNKEAHVVVEIWGPTIKYMLKNSKEEKDFEKFVKQSNGRIQFHVCENTMHKFHITKNMMGDFAKPVKGALIDMNKLEKEGYMYVKP
ncbi:MAG: DsrE family protein [Hydrogenobaculum sp.]